MEPVVIGKTTLRGARIANRGDDRGGVTRVFPPPGSKPGGPVLFPFFGPQGFGVWKNGLSLNQKPGKGGKKGSRKKENSLLKRKPVSPQNRGGAGPGKGKNHVG